MESYGENEILVETYWERLEGLKEMFPESVRSLATSSVSAGVTAFGYTKQVLWVLSTTALIMVLPLVVEKERAEHEKAQVSQQRQMLLGPQAALKH